MHTLLPRSQVKLASNAPVFKEYVTAPAVCFAVSFRKAITRDASRLRCFARQLRGRGKSSS